MPLEFEVIGRAIGRARNEAIEASKKAVDEVKSELTSAMLDTQLTAEETRVHVDSLVEGLQKQLDEQCSDLLNLSHEAFEDLRERIDGVQLKEGAPGKDGRDGLDGIDGADKPLVEPVNIVSQKDYPKNTVGTFAGGLWITTKNALGNPEEDPHAWECVLDGIADVAVELKSDHKYELSVRMGTGAEFKHEFDIPFPEHVGIWEEGKAYKSGQIVTKATAMWMALKDTAEPPPANGWRQILTAPRGKQGPAGKSIVGPQGKPGRNGKDAELPEGFLDSIKALASKNKRFVDGRSAAEAITSFRGYFDQTETYRSGDVVNSGGDLYLCTSGGTFKSIAESSANWEILVHVPKPGFTPYMYWQGKWDSQRTYAKGYVVIDDGYLMVANKETNDPAAPVRIGDPFYAYAGTISEDVQSAKQVIFGNRYTFGTTGYLSGYRIYTVLGNVYRVFTIDGNGRISELASFTATATGWADFPVSAVFIVPGLSFDLVAVVQEPDDTPVTVTANYNYQTPQNPAVPAAGAMQHSRGQPDVIDISYEDSDGTDRTSIIQGLSIGDVIDGAGQRWAIQANIDQGGYASISVTPSLTGSPIGIQAFNFETKATTPITYGFDTDYWLSNPPGNGSAQGLLGIDQEYVDITPDDTAYGVDIQVQPATVSEDWDFMSYTDTLSGDSGKARLETFGVQTVNPTVDTTDASWVEIKRSTMTPSTGYSGTLNIDAKRIDDVGYYSTRLEVLAYEDGGVNDQANHRYELGDNQLSVRVRGDGGDLVFEVKGKAGEEWHWDMIESYREIS